VDTCEKGVVPYLELTSELILEGVLPPSHLIQPHRLIESFQGHGASVNEYELFALGQLPDDVGDEYLAALSLACYPRRKLTAVPYRSSSSAIGSPAFSPTHTSIGFSAVWLCWANARCMVMAHSRVRLTGSDSRL